jgi:hypothetical protein
VDEDTTRLVTALEEMATLLAGHSERDWADWISKDVAWIRRGDGYGVLHLLSAFGGMGSLNDVVFHPMNGNVAQTAEAGPVNERFQALTSEVYRLAVALRHDAQDP